MEIKTSNWLFAGTDSSICFRLAGYKDGQGKKSPWKCVSGKGGAYERGRLVLSLLYLFHSDVIPLNKFVPCISLVLIMKSCYLHKILMGYQVWKYESGKRKEAELLTTGNLHG